MKKKFLLALSSISVLFATNAFAATSEILTDKTCLHKEPLNSQVLAIIPANTTVEILESQNEWKKIKYNEIEGWYSLPTQQTASSSTGSNASQKIVQNLSKVTRTWKLAGKTYTSSGDQSNYPALSRSNLVFPSKEHSKINPVFADRLNNLAKALGGKLKITSGFRSIDSQISLIKRYYSTGKYTIGSGGKLQQNGETMVARPGYSKHQAGIAVDIANSGIAAKVRKMTKAQLKQFGLYKPMAYEPWHLQPIL